MIRESPECMAGVGRMHGRGRPTWMAGVGRVTGVGDRGDLATPPQKAPV
jgi:hypothetical protein